MRLFSRRVLALFLCRLAAAGVTKLPGIFVRVHDVRRMSRQLVSIQTPVLMCVGLVSTCVRKAWKAALSLSAFGAATVVAGGAAPAEAGELSVC